MPGKKQRTPQDDIAFLADRLALALMFHERFIEATVMLPSREPQREELRAEPEYANALDLVREVLRVAKGKKPLR